MDVFPEISLDDYKLIKKIGEGGYAKVYLIEHKQELKNYAAKESNEILNDQDPNSSFYKEIESHSKSGNPAILKLFGYSLTNFDDEPFPIMITEYMTNGSLGEMLNKASKGLATYDFTSTKKYIILLGIALGMKFLHFKGVIHRDLKPDNVLLDDSLYPKISDFGCSFVSPEEIFDQLLNEEVGTPIYMAPEIFNEEYFTHMIDVYAFAFLAYELITGNKPFTEYSNQFQLFNDVIAGKRPDLTKLDPVLQTFLSKCWNQKYSERPSFGQIVAEIMQPEFKEAFGILDEDEIDEYLDLFDDDLKDPKMMDCSNLKEQKNRLRRLNCETKMPRNGEWLNKKEIIDSYKLIFSQSENPMIKLYYAVEMNNNGDEHDKKESLKILKKLSDDGNNEATFYYAEALRYGNGVPQDLKKAAELTKISADKGFRLAMEKYADMLHEGIGVQVNPKEAVRYVKMAADEGQLNSMYKYGTSCLVGYGIKQNIEEGTKYIEMAAKRYHPLAMVEYGKMLIRKDINDKDRKSVV